MLKELSSTYPDKETRRWFSDDYIDLVIWTEASDVKGFQLCYDKRGTERAVTWFRNTGFSHERIDNGELDPEKNCSPILVPDGRCQVQTLIGDFKSRSEGLDPAIRSLVLDKLTEYSEHLQDGGIS